MAKTPIWIRVWRGLLSYESAFSDVMRWGADNREFVIALVGISTIASAATLFLSGMLGANAEAALVLLYLTLTSLLSLSVFVSFMRWRHLGDGGVALRAQLLEECRASPGVNLFLCEGASFLGRLGNVLILSMLPLLPIVVISGTAGTLMVAPDAYIAQLFIVGGAIVAGVMVHFYLLFRLLPLALEKLRGRTISLSQAWRTTRGRGCELLIVVLIAVFMGMTATFPLRGLVELHPMAFYLFTTLADMLVSLFVAAVVARNYWPASTETGG